MLIRPSLLLLLTGKLFKLPLKHKSLKTGNRVKLILPDGYNVPLEGKEDIYFNHKSFCGEYRSAAWINKPIGGVSSNRFGLVFLLAFDMIYEL